MEVIIMREWNIKLWKKKERKKDKGREKEKDNGRKKENGIGIMTRMISSMVMK